MACIRATVAVVFSCGACEGTWFTPARETATVLLTKSDEISAKRAASKNALTLR